MKNKNIFKINIIYFIAISGVAITFLFGYLGLLKSDILSSFLIQIVVMFAIPLLMYSLFTKSNLKQTFNDVGLKKISSKIIFYSIILGFVLYFLNTFVASSFSSILSLLGYNTLSSSTPTKITYVTLLKELILSCVLPGFCEEFLHRGIMLHAGKKYSNTKYCLIISSILFGLIHLNIRQFLYAAILGFLMGYVTLVADSIIPSIIIHFMNNFLSSYFYYGNFFDWPLAKFINHIESILFNNSFTFITSTVFAVIGLIYLYQYLTKKILYERTKSESLKVFNALQISNLSIIQAQIKFNEINQIIKYKALNSNKNKPKFPDKIFLISSFVLGILITISSFIWGVI